jgi:hypothetical protein
MPTGRGYKRQFWANPRILVGLSAKKSNWLTFGLPVNRERSTPHIFIEPVTDEVLAGALGGHYYLYLRTSVSATRSRRKDRLKEDRNETLVGQGLKNPPMNREIPWNNGQFLVWILLLFF